MSRVRTIRAVSAFGIVLTAVPVSLLAGAPSASAVEPMPVPGTFFQDGIYVPVNDWPVGNGGSEGSVVLNGNLTLTWAETSFSPTIDENDELAALEAELGLRGAITLDVHAETTGEFEETFELATVPVGSFAAGPATVTSYLGLNLRVSGEADAGAQVGLVAPFNVTAALSGDSGVPDTSIPTPPAFDPELALPDLAGALAASLQVELEPTLTFQISMPNLPLPFGGPVFALTLGTRVDVEPGGTPWWQLRATAGLKYGWSFPDATGFPQPAKKMRNLLPERRWVVARAQDTGPVANVSTRWSTAYDVGNYGGVGGLLADGDSLTLMEAGGSPDGYPWLATLDGTGVPIAEQQSTEMTSFSSVARTPDGGVIGAGSDDVERFDIAGVSQWKREVTVPGAFSTKWDSIVSTADGPVLTGAVHNSNRPLVLGLDDNGQVRWATEIDFGTAYDDASLIAAAAAPDGSVIAVGSIRNITDPLHDFYDLLVVRIDAQGIVQNAFSLGGSLTDMGTAIAVQDDGSYAVTGRATDDPGDTFSSAVARFDSSDQLMWSWLYRDGEQANGPVEPTSIAAIPGGDYVVSGTTGHTPDAWLMRIDSTGMPVWSKSFVGADSDRLTEVVVMPSGVAAAGSSTTLDPGASSYDSTWVVRTSVDGTVHFDPSAGITSVNRSVEWIATDAWLAQSLTTAQSTPVLSVTDEPFGSAPVVASVRPLT